MPSMRTERGEERPYFGTLTLGTGVGGGIIFAGKLLHAWTELGHMVIVEDGEPCQGACAGRGHVEAYCSGHAATRVAQEAIGPHATAHDLIEQQHPALESIGHHLGVAIGSLVNIFGLERMAIGGGFGVAAFEQLLPAARSAVLREVLGDGGRRPADRARAARRGRRDDRRRSGRARGARRRSRASRDLRDADREPRRHHAARARGAARGRSRARRGHAAHARPARRGTGSRRGFSPTTSTTRRRASRSSCRGSRRASGSRSSRTPACRASPIRARGSCARRSTPASR